MSEASMSLWCCGSEAFIKSIQRLAKAIPLADPGELQKGDALILDLDEPGLTEPMAKITELSALGCNIIVACESKSMVQAVEAVKLGAQQIAIKPVKAQDIEAVAPLSQDVHDDLVAWREKYAYEIVGDSPALFEALEIAAQAADCDCPVLISGESGTGKELLARAFHRASSREDKPFVPVNCPAIPKELVESELFGHAKGAFTGATMARMGRFAAADGGTLFLDEIGEMDQGIQSKLLRVLQDYQITRVGESRCQQVDVRVIAATNRNLEEMVSKGSFREDLFYRLNVIQIHLPSLKERREDIPLLVEHFLKAISKQRGLPAPELTPRARDAMAAYDWPGNVRQLRNVIERLIILRRGKRVDLKQLPEVVTRHTQHLGSEQPFFGTVQLPVDGINLKEALQRFEDSMIKQALTSTNGNKNQAAKILGLNRTTLVEKLRKRSVAA
jgi:DNA-binding NtrC family response regulator